MKPRKYLSLTEFAARVGVKQGSMSKYKLPPHDAEIGQRRGWLPETVDKWNAARPGRGKWRAE